MGVQHYSIAGLLLRCRHTKKGLNGCASDGRPTAALFVYTWRTAVAVDFGEESHASGSGFGNARLA